MAGELRALGVELAQVDVAGAPHLRLRYGRDVPVLVLRDIVVRHRLTPEAIAKLR